MKLQAVKDAPTDQNFRQVERRFPIQPADVAEPTKDLFLQFIEATGLKGKTGEASAAFPGGTTTSGIVEIPHGLGSVPVWFDGVTFASEASTIPVEVRLISRSESAVRVRLFAPSVVAANTIDFLWIAIG